MSNKQNKTNWIKTYNGIALDGKSISCKILQDSGMIINGLSAGIDPDSLVCSFTEKKLRSF